MNIMNSFLFLGGDPRSLYAADYLNRTRDCFVYGFPEPVRGENGCRGARVLREIGRFQNVVLPVPTTHDGLTLNAPFSKEPLPIGLVETVCERGGTVFCAGSCPLLEEVCERLDARLFDYLAREEFAVMNAVPTAEGALEIIMRERERTIDKTRFLVTGYGRIARLTARYLAALGGTVTVAARRKSDLAWAEIGGCYAVEIAEMESVLPLAEVIVNTVPAPLFGGEALSKIKSGTLLLDLASSPCASASDAEILGIRYIHALSLPGKAAPITAGEIIARTILGIADENGGDSNVRA